MSCHVTHVPWAVYYGHGQLDPRTSPKDGARCAMAPICWRITAYSPVWWNNFLNKKVVPSLFPAKIIVLKHNNIVPKSEQYYHKNIIIPCARIWNIFCSRNITGPIILSIGNDIILQLLALEAKPTLGELWSLSCGAGGVERERSELRNPPCGTRSAERESKGAKTTVDPNITLEQIPLHE